MLLDPYGLAVAVPKNYDRMAGTRPDRDPRTAMKSVVADLSGYDWEGDKPLRLSFGRTVIYELHVRGFTAHPNSGVDRSLAGTYAGLIDKIPYLQSLGVTAVELMPVQAFDPQSAPNGLPNYWGYSPVSFFAPHAAYASTGDPLDALDEFRTMVKELHRAGIEVILDVVFNHTAEGDADGPTFCWRGFDNRAYYLLDPANPAHYLDYTGCGNTTNANNAVFRRMAVDALHHWVEQMHVDGFRFDLASAMARDTAGTPTAEPPVLFQIETDPVLAGTKLIAEAWDAAGLYQLGTFAGDRWREWNGKFRDDIRRFVRGDRHTVELLPNRLLASPDLFGGRPAEVEHSINFVACHDGFTLNDLVSYTHKHNWVNGEDNRDGSNDNFSTNCGVEGPVIRPGGRGHAHPAGQEHARHHADRHGRADDRHGRRGAPNPVGQQQSLLPGQRDQLVRLDAAREVRRHPPIRPQADRRPAGARHDQGHARSDAAGVPHPFGGRVPRRPSAPARLVGGLARAGADRPQRDRHPHGARDPQQLDPSPGLRTATAVQSDDALAAHRGHRTRSARRHLRSGDTDRRCRD